MNDELYQAPLEEFIAVRDALAARLKAAGDTDGAAAAKRARKPSVPAWAANQVVQHAPDEWGQLQAAAQALRRTQGEAASPNDRRDAARDQREALRACTARAAERLAQHGHAATPAILQKVDHTLLALAYGAPGAGRLEQELPPPGFEALAGLTLVPPLPAAAARPTPVPPEPPSPRAPAPAGAKAAEARRKEEQAALERERVQHQAAVTAAEARLAEGRRALATARARLTAEEARRQALEAEIATLRRACDDARVQLEAAEAEDAAAGAALQALRRPAE